MPTKLDELTELFKKQIGTMETPVNNVIYNTHYYGGAVNGSQYPWCCAFIWDVFRMAGMSSLFCGGQKTAYCPFVVNYARQHGQWVTNGYRHGDLLLYDWNSDGGADHIGFCVEWSGDKGLAIEGNVSGSGGDGVHWVTRYTNQVLGAYRPAYPTEAKDDEKHDASEETSTYTVKQGDSLWEIAKTYLGSGLKYEAIAELNGLKSTQIYPGQVLKLPTKSDRQTFSVTVSAATYRLLFDAAQAQGVSVGTVIDKLAEGLK